VTGRLDAARRRLPGELPSPLGPGLLSRLELLQQLRVRRHQRAVQAAQLVDPRHQARARLGLARLHVGQKPVGDVELFGERPHAQPLVALDRTDLLTERRRQRPRALVSAPPAARRPPAVLHPAAPLSCPFASDQLSACRTETA